MKTEVCITIDTEFDIAGTFVDPGRFAPVAEPSVRCEQQGHSHGLGFLLAMLARYELPATFFVETLNSIYFGDGPMRNVTGDIVRAGHDAQLHLHPVWTYFRDPRWRERLARHPPNDSFVGRSQDEVEELIELGRTVFTRWNLGEPVALRTGGLHVDRTVYDAMHAQGIPLGSNVGIGIYQPQAEALQLYAGRHRVNGVTEIPILTYRRTGLPRRIGEKTLTVTGTSWREMRRLLWAAHRAGVGPVVLLSHPHEFAKRDRKGGWRPNRINQYRLRRLCEFLARRRDKFQVVTFGERAQRWRAAASGRAPILRVPAMHGLGGIVENLCNDWMLTFGACLIGGAGALASCMAVGGGLPGV